MSQNNKRLQKANPEKHNTRAAQQDSELLIPISNNTQINLSALPEDTKDSMLARYAEGTIDNAVVSHKLAVENTSIAEKMGNMTHTVSTASEAGASITVTSTIEDSMGRTEVILGNTDTAAKGKLTRSQRGDKDNIMLFVVIGAVVIVLLGLFAAMGS